MSEAQFNLFVRFNLPGYIDAILIINIIFTISFFILTELTNRSEIMISVTTNRAFGCCSALYSCNYLRQGNNENKTI